MEMDQIATEVAITGDFRQETVKLIIYFGDGNEIRPGSCSFTLFDVLLQLKKLFIAEMFAGEGCGRSDDHGHSIHNLDKLKNA
jgi:hypothetical protein